MSYLNIVNFVQTSPADPTGTTSTTGVMMGLAIAFTPIKTGCMYVSISASAQNSVSTDGASGIIYFGTGTAPTNGSAITGTQLGNFNQITRFSANSTLIPISFQGVVSGLTIGTVYWVDIAFRAITGGTANINNLSVSIFEK